MKKQINKKQEDKKTDGRKPDYKGDGVAVWENEDINGNLYLSIRIPLLNININAFALDK